MQYIVPMAYDQEVYHAATLAEAAMQIALEEMRRGRTEQAAEHLRLALERLTAALDGEAVRR